MRTDEHLYDELKRLKKENARLTEERDLLKRRQRTLPEKRGEVRLNSGTERELLRCLVVCRVVSDPQCVLCVGKSGANT